MVYSQTRFLTNSVDMPFLFVITGLICVLKWPIWLENMVVITECSLTAEFVITEFDCTTFSHAKVHLFFIRLTSSLNWLTRTWYILICSLISCCVKQFLMAWRSSNSGFLNRCAVISFQVCRKFLLVLNFQLHWE